MKFLKGTPVLDMVLLDLAGTAPTEQQTPSSKHNNTQALPTCASAHARMALVICGVGITIIAGGEVALDRVAADTSAHVTGTNSVALVLRITCHISALF